MPKADANSNAIVVPVTGLPVPVGFSGPLGPVTLYAIPTTAGVTTIFGTENIFARLRLFLPFASCAAAVGPPADGPARWSA